MSDIYRSVSGTAKIEEGTFVMSDDNCAASDDCFGAENMGEHIFYNHFGIIKCFQKESNDS